MKNSIGRSNEKRRNTLKNVCRVALCCVVIAACFAGLKAQSGKITAKDQKAAEVMTAAIKALGGEKNIDNVKSLILTGSIKSPAGKSPTDDFSQEVELRILFPDNFLWITTRNIPAVNMKITSYLGVADGEFINASFGGPGVTMVTSAGYDQANDVNRIACLLMGALFKPLSAATHTFSSLPNTPDRFSIATDNGTLCEMELDPKEKYPLLIGYKDLRMVSAQKPPPDAPKSDAKTTVLMGSMMKSEAVDAVMRFKDRVAADGVMFPKTIVVEVGKSVTEYQFDKIQINPKLTLKDFELPK